MIERIIVRVVVKLLEILGNRLIRKADRAAKEIEESKADDKQKEIVLKELDDAVTKAERIKASLKLINS